MRPNSMKTVVGRIQKLEFRFGAALDALQNPPGPPSESAAEVLKRKLAAMGIVQQGNESLAETAARAMGISLQEFRAELQRRAAGAQT